MENTKKYSVVIFTEENCVEMIPSEWLMDEESCMWPDGMSEGKLRKAVIDCAAYQSSCNVRILYETDDYLVARQKVKLDEVTNDIQSEAQDEESHFNSGKRKRTIPKRLIDDSSSDDSEPIIPTYRPKKSRSSTTEKVHRKSDSYILQPPPVAPLINLHKTPRSPNVGRYEAATDLIGFTSPSSQKAVRSTPVTTPKAANTVSATERKLISLLEEVKSLMSEVKQSVDTNTAAVKAMIGGTLPSGQALPVVPLDWPAPLPRLPIDSLFHLKEFESKLASQKNADVVGTSQVTRNILKTLMSTLLQTKLNWMGLNRTQDEDKKKEGFVKFERLISLIFRAVRSNPQCSHASTHEIQDVIKSLLKYSLDKDGGRKERRSKGGNPSVDSE